MGHSMTDPSKKEVLEKLKALPNQELFLQLGDRSIKISHAINAVETNSATGLELVRTFEQNRELQRFL